MNLNELVRAIEHKSNLIVIVLEHNLADRLAKECGGPDDWKTWNLMGTPVKVGMGSQSYLVQDSFQGPLIHML